jgi:sulfur-carrier protein
MPAIRVILPYHLTVLARCDREISLDITLPLTIKAVLDALEGRYPMLAGTVREHGTLKRRPLVRFYACEEDLSHVPQETVLPDLVASGKEPFIILGAIAGG